MRRLRRIPSEFATRIVNIPARVAAERFLDLEVSGAEHIPGSGPLVVAPNHLSHVDPPIVVNAVGRLVRFLAVDGLFGNHLTFDIVTGFFGAIPTNRDGAPLRALEEAIDHLRRGGAVGVFPEGRRVGYWGETAPKRGAAWLSWMGGAPLLPIAIHGTERTLGPVMPGLRRTSIRVWIGEPLVWHDFSDREDPVGAMTDAWRGFVDSKIGPWWAR